MKTKPRQRLYVKPEETPVNNIGKCYDYLCRIGLHWMDATYIVGRYPIDDIRYAVLQLKNNNVNVTHRKRELLKLLAGKEHEVWRS